MIESTVSDETTASGERKGGIARFVFGGAALGVLTGAVISGGGYLFRAYNLRDISLTTYFIVYPVVGAFLGWLSARNPAARGWKRQASFFATEPLSEEEREVRGRRVRRSAWIGTGAGIVVAVAASALDFAWRGWPYLSETLMFSLYFYPYLGAILGFNLALRPGDPKLSLRDVRFGMRTLMILTAYIAVCLAVKMQVSRVSGDAKIYLVKSQGAQATIPVFQNLLDQSTRDLARTKNASELRAGRIPDGLLASQKEFLKSLDQTATEAYRRERYGLIADGEQRQADLAVGNVEVFGRIVDYYKQLAEKYDRAAHQPWLPVEPDPPMPGTPAPAPSPPTPTSG